MSFSDREMQAVSILGALILTSSLSLPVAYLTRRAEPTKTRFDNMESIEATIAYKSTKKQTQPQKKTSQPTPKKDEGVSRDEKKKPALQCKSAADCKPDEICKSGRCEAREEKKQESVADALAKFHHSDDDADPGAPVTQPGEYHGDERGWAPVTSGDPFWQGFVKDLRDHFTLPTISDANDPPEGCFHITPDGKIVETVINKKSDSPDLELAMENALDAVQKLRNANPIQVPTEDLGTIIRPVCFHFDPNKL